MTVLYVTVNLHRTSAPTSNEAYIRVHVYIRLICRLSDQYGQVEKVQSCIETETITVQHKKFD